jgi:hypothetical protein
VYEEELTEQSSRIDLSAMQKGIYFIRLDKQIERIIVR